MKLGFVGTGTITAAIVRGLGKDFAGTIHLSPRNAEISGALAQAFAHVTVAASNQAVLDASDIVVLAVRPQVAGEVLGALKFRAGQQVISLIATASLEMLKALVAPANHVTKAVPLPSVELGRGPTAIYPPDAVTASIFASLWARRSKSTVRKPLTHSPPPPPPWRPILLLPMPSPPGWWARACRRTTPASSWRRSSTDFR